MSNDPSSWSSSCLAGDHQKKELEPELDPAVLPPPLGLLRKISLEILL